MGHKKSVASAVTVMAFVGAAAATGGAAHAASTPADASGTLPTQARILTFADERGVQQVLDVRNSSTARGMTVIQWTENGGSNQAWRIQRWDPKGGTFRFINVNSGMCLTTDGVAGDPVYQWPCTTNDSDQVWAAAEFNTGGTGTIESAGSHLFLDVNQSSYLPGASIITWYGNGAANQKFHLG